MKIQKTKEKELITMKMLESIGAVYTHTSNLIKKTQAFLCFICDIYGRQIKFYLSFLYFQEGLIYEERKWNNINCINDNYNCDFNIGTE